MYQKISFDETDPNCIVVKVVEKKNSKPSCSECNRKCPVYDHRPQRTFWFIPFWIFKIKILYSPRRADCPEHGVLVENIPWAIGKRPVTKALACFLSRWAKKMSWKEVASAFGFSWDIVYASVEWVVQYGLKHRCLDKITTIGIDEVLFKRGYQFVTLVYEISEGSKRLLWIGVDRKCKTLLKFFRMLGEARSKNIQFVSCDMWRPFLQVIERKVPWALQILDRFHIMKKFNEAVDEVRRQEVQALHGKAKGESLKNARWAVLKNPENLTDKQNLKLKDLLAQNLKTIKVYLLKESFQKFWTYMSQGCASKFLDQWCCMAMRSKIEPIKKVARMLRRHRSNILNWFKATPRISNGVVEGFNNKVKLVMRQHYGFRTFPAFEVALYHTMGNLPEPQISTHRFY